MLTRSFDEKEKKLTKVMEEAKTTSAGDQEISHRMYDVGYKDGSIDSTVAGVAIGALGTVAGAIVISAVLDFKRFVVRKIEDYKLKKALK